MSELSFPFKMFVTDMDGVMTDGGIFIGNNGLEMRRFSIYDGMAFTILHRHGVITGILSNGHEEAFAASRAHQLKIKYCYTGLEKKLDILQQWAEESGVAFADIAYVGDDINDLEILKQVGYSACPRNAVPEVKAVAKYQLSRGGGEGCLREFIQLTGGNTDDRKD